MRPDLRSEPRYFLVSPLEAEIGGVHADVVDLSTKGARLQLTQALKVGANVNFQINLEDATVATTASVLWCDAAALALHDEESDRYLCGVGFQRSLSVVRHLIHDLCVAGSAVPIEESRRSERYRVTVPLAATFGALECARVLDLSFRGARLTTPSMLQAGTSGKLHFRIGESDMPVEVTATVMWSRPAQRKGRFETGLRIDDGEAWLRAVIDELSLRHGILVEEGTLSRKYDPLATARNAGLVGILR